MIYSYQRLLKRISTFCLAFSLAVCLMHATDREIINTIKAEIDNVQKHIHLFTTHYGIVKSADATALTRQVVNRLQGNTKHITNMIIEAVGILDVVARRMKNLITSLNALPAEQQSKVIKLLTPLRESIELIEVIIEPKNLSHDIMLDATLVQAALKRFIEGQKNETADARNYVHVIALKDIYTTHAPAQERGCLQWVDELIYYEYPSKSGNLTTILVENWGEWPFDLYTLAALQQWKEQYAYKDEAGGQNPVFEAEAIMISKVNGGLKTDTFRTQQYQRLCTVFNAELEKLALPSSKIILFQRASRALKIAQQYLYRQQEKLDLLHTKLEEHLEGCLKKNNFQSLPV